MQYLNIDARNEIRIPLTSLIGESIAVLGIRGSGKTNTAAVLIEELLSGGLPLTIVDIEGEYWGLKEKFEILVVGKSPNTDIEVQAQQAARFAEFSVKNSVSMILDLSEFNQAEMSEFLLQYFKALWKYCFTERKPYEVVLEEAHEFVPQTTRSPLKEVLTRIALRGRKRGLGMILVSQRSAKVEKDVLTQASMLLLHRVVHPIDIRVYQEIIPLPSRQVEEMVTRLRRGEAIFYSNHEVTQIQVRVRDTFHAGATPELSSSNVPKLRKIDKHMLEELRALANQPGEREDEDQIQKLERLLVAKEEEIELQKEIIRDLKTQIGVISKLSLSVEELPVIVTELTRNRQIESDFDIDNETASKPEKGRNRDSQSDVARFQVTPDQVSAELDAEIRRQEKRFNILLEDIGKLPRFHRLILSFLLEREDVAMNARDLAKWLGLSETTIKNKPPLDLIKMRLLSRSGGKGSQAYKSSVRQTFIDEFSALNPADLIEKLLAKCS